MFLFHLKQVFVILKRDQYDLGTSPIHFPGFEKNQLFHLRVDLHTLGYFLNTRVVGIEIRAILKIPFSLGKCLNGIALHHLTFFLTVKCCLSSVSYNRRAELDNMGL